MRQMQIGELILFYHSSCKDIGVYGIAQVASLPYPDPTQYNESSHYFESRATKDKPLWDLVDVEFVEKLEKPVLLPSIRANKKLESMVILQPRNRLSVTPVTKEEFEEIVKMSA